MIEVLVENEYADDVGEIRSVNDAAFGQAAEGAIVDALRAEGALAISLVARREEKVIGHVALSPVETVTTGELVLGLGPVGVLPAEQRRGIGSALIRAGLERAKAERWDGVVVLGYRAYYRRFGFEPASRFGMRCEYDVPDESFMAIELTPAGLSDCAGLVRYHAAFALAAP
ncbi:MAG: N-acetyltransferase [Planctomycetaceae bacterium]